MGAEQQADRWDRLALTNVTFEDFWLLNLLLPSGLAYKQPYIRRAPTGTPPFRRELCVCVCVLGDQQKAPYKLPIVPLWFHLN